MKRIGLLSDTHGWLDPAVFEHFEACDEIWHAGDIGSLELADQLEAFRPLRAVYGNIDDQAVRLKYPEDQVFIVEDVKICMTHIAGRPGRYPKRVKELLRQEKPAVFICGHSHILKVMYDQAFQVLHINPGACGRQGLHTVRTLIRFDLSAGKIDGLEVVELGPRGR